MGNTSFNRPFYLSLQIPRRWRIVYVLITPMLFVVALLSSRRSFNSLQVLRGFDVALEHENAKHEGLRRRRFTSYPERSKGQADVNRLKWLTPSPLSEEYVMRRGSDFAEQQGNHSWQQPLVFLAHLRRSRKPARHMEVFLYMTGVSMGNFEREFRVMGCVVGNDVYRAVGARLDVAMCKVPREIEDGEKLSVAVLKDENLEKAMMGPVELKLGMRVKLNKGDVVDLGPSVKSHIKKMDAGELMAVRSVVRAETLTTGIDKEDVPTQPRYEVCMVTQMKPYPHLLDDWIDYHRRLGVDMVYIMDNGAPEDLDARFSSRPDVEVLFWPWGRSQVQAVSWFLISARRSCEWILFTDADEYLMFGVGEKKGLAGRRVLKEFVNTKRSEGYLQLFFRFIIMGPSAHVRIPKNPPPEAYTYLRGTETKNGKVMCQTDADWFHMRVHWAKGFAKVKSYEVESRNLYPVEPEDGPSLVHYQFRSWEEQGLKVEAGSPSINDNHVDDFRSIPKSPPQGFYRLEEGKKYTHFRDIWREVTRKAELNEQTIVRIRGDSRCTVVRTLDGKGDRFGEESCEEI